jgi:SH3-like domain-containing protein
MCSFKAVAIIFIVTALCSLGAYAHASEYRSLRSDEVNMRVGPGKMFPILWHYQRRGLPLKVIDTHQDWVQLEDEAGESGWVYEKLLSTTMTAVTLSDNVLLYRKPDNNSDVMAKIMRYVVVVPSTCRPSWCYVSVAHEGEIVKGWVRKINIWGVETHTVFEEE